MVWIVLLKEKQVSIMTQNLSSCVAHSCWFTALAIIFSRLSSWVTEKWQGVLRSETVCLPLVLSRVQQNSSFWKVKHAGCIFHVLCVARTLSTMHAPSSWCTASTTELFMLLSMTHNKVEGEETRWAHIIVLCLSFASPFLGDVLASNLLALFVRGVSLPNQYVLHLFLFISRIREKRRERKTCSLKGGMSLLPDAVRTLLAEREKTEAESASVS